MPTSYFTTQRYSYADSDTRHALASLYATPTNPTIYNYRQRYENLHEIDILPNFDIEENIQAEAMAFKEKLISKIGKNIDTNTVKVNTHIDIELDSTTTEHCLRVISSLMSNKTDTLKQIESEISTVSLAKEQAPSNMQIQYQDHMRSLTEKLADTNKQLQDLDILYSNLSIKNTKFKVLEIHKNIFNSCYQLLERKLTEDYDVLQYYPSLYRSKKLKNSKILNNLSKLGNKENDIRLTAV